MACAPQKESLSSAVRASGGSVAGQWKLKVKVTQSRPTLCDPMDCAVRGMLQARRVAWAAFPFSGGSSQPRDGTQVSRTAGGFFTR